MKTNTRAHISFSRSLRGDGLAPMAYPLGLSFVFHVVFLVAFVFTPSLHIERPPAQSVINVSMVSFKNTAAPTAPSPVVDKKTPAVEKPAEPQKTPVKPPEKKAVAIEKPLPTPKPKTSLKKQTFKSTEVVKHAIKQLEEKADRRTESPEEAAASPEMLKSALDRLRQQVSKTEAAKGSATAKGDATSGAGNAKVGKFNEDGKRTAELIDLYRLEIAFQIQKNWAFNEQLAGGDQSLAAAIVFKVMPDGQIQDIFFTDRSGNAYLDESAYKAIVKSNPVDAHPQGLNQPSVIMAIRFTPQGIR